MTTKQNAIDLANTARSEAANTEKRTIASIIANWNECVKQAGFTGVFDFPTTGYTRKAQLIADLERCAAQLDNYCEPNPYAPRNVEQQTREFNAALSRVLDADEAHTEALVINHRLNKAKKTVLGKVVSGATKCAESYGRFYTGQSVSHIDIDFAKSYGGALSTNDMKHGCYSVAAFNR
ncbi:hypothetical protein [Serratia fonticola]|uniref:Uncharacterized protein n=1 Tax=Serratia fonticola TaxID=47917 RepID=A0AAW3WU42_SERFO|nr:hypothetical protein [Serratia fonticola]MBC3214269.1 hypothetical protein [Serratia fonticola]NYA13660.1 hypothetical protein [Serratia fonticola]NYA35120.1 hypothetical protein [Serratia fonticola]